MTAVSPIPISLPAGLRWQWRLVSFLFILGAMLAYGLLRRAGFSVPAGQWAALVALPLGYELWLLRRKLGSNHPRGRPFLLSSLGPGNAITLARGLLLGLLAGFLFTPWPEGLLAWAPALLYTAAAIMDGLDGYIARVSGHATLLGEILDIEFDGLAVLLVSALAVWYGQWPAWTLLIGLSRPLFLFGIWQRRRRGLPVYAMTESVHRRIVATLYMGFISVILWPIVAPPATTFAVYLFAVPLALSFGRDWLVVSGAIDPASPGYRRVIGGLVKLATQRLPLLLRTLVVASGTLLLLAGLPWPQATATSALALGLIALPMIALGWLGRLAAIALIIPATAHMLAAGLTWANSILLASLITLLFTGTGPYSLWRPEEAILSRRIGKADDEAPSAGLSLTAQDNTTDDENASAGPNLTEKATIV